MPGLLLRDGPVTKHLLLLLALLGALAGCQATVGDACDEERARVVVELGDDRAYAGQALVLQSCASDGSQCHASTAMRRYGAPFGMNFDPVLTRRFDSGGDTAVAQRHLYQAQLNTHLLRDDIFAAVTSGSMPLGATGDGVRPMIGYTYPDGRALESIRSAEGRELLRNWLACGSPVIENVRVDGDPVAPSLPCQSDADCPSHRCAAGTCDGVGLVVVSQAPPIQPTFDDIYDRIISVRCAHSVCHGAVGWPMAAGLDMSTIDNAYMRLVDHVAENPLCGTRVVPMHPEQSLMVAKIEGTQDARLCGHRMPSLGVTLTPAEIAAIRQWITDGAMPPGA